MGNVASSNYMNNNWIIKLGVHSTYRQVSCHIYVGNKITKTAYYVLLYSFRFVFLSPNYIKLQGTSNVEKTCYIQTQHHTKFHNMSSNKCDD